MTTLHPNSTAGVAQAATPAAAPPRRSRTRALLTAAVVFGGIIMGSAQATWMAWPDTARGTGPVEAEVQPEPDPAREAAAARKRARCATCGFVQSIRPLDTPAGAPASYEFTVRLHDGTSRVSQVADVGSWRIGDRIMLIGYPTAAGG